LQFVVGILKLIKFSTNNSSFVVDLYLMVCCLEMLLALTVPFTVLTLLVGWHKERRACYMTVPLIQKVVVKKLTGNG